MSLVVSLSPSASVHLSLSGARIHKFAFMPDGIKFVCRHEKAIYCEIYAAAAARREESLPLKRRFLLDGRAHTKRKCWNVHARFDLFERDGMTHQCGFFYAKKWFFYMPVLGINGSVFRKKMCDAHRHIKKIYKLEELVSAKNGLFSFKIWCKGFLSKITFF